MTFMDAAAEFWKSERARELLHGLGYEWDVDQADDDEVVGLAEQEGYTWDDHDHAWYPD